MNRKIFGLLSLLIVVFGITLRMTDFSRSLEYDEIWTLEQYVSAPVSAIFADLSIPNNHPFHSCLVKAAFAVFGPSVPVLRLPALLGSVAALLLCYPLALRLFHSRRVALFAQLLFACNVWGAIYGQVARGYSIQLALLMFCAWGLLEGRRRLAGLQRIFWYAAAAVAAMLAVLTLPTSVLYLAPLYALLLWNDRRDFALWISGGIAGIFSLGWLGVNYAQFRQGQVFGVAIGSVGEFLQFLSTTLTELVPWPLLLFAGATFCFKPRHRLAVALALLVLFPLFAALLTRAGGSRVYQPIIPPLLFLASLGVWSLYRLAMRRRVERRVCLAVPLVALVAAFWSYRVQSEAMAIPDWRTVYDLVRDLPAEVIVAYPGNDCVTAEWNNREEGITSDFAARLSCSAPERYLLQLGSHHALNGLSEDGGERQLPVPVSGQKLQMERSPGVLFRLEPLREKPEDLDIVLAVFPPQTPERLREQASELNRFWPDWLMLNQPLCTEIPTENGIRRVRLFAVRAGDYPEHWPEILAMANPELQFYRLR